jgi:hypothetical protein
VYLAGRVIFTGEVTGNDEAEDVATDRFTTARNRRARRGNFRLTKSLLIKQPTVASNLGHWRRRGPKHR